MEEITSEQNEVNIELVRFLKCLVEDAERIIPKNWVVLFKSKMIIGRDEDSEAV